MYVGLKQPRGDGERYVTPARAAAKETTNLHVSLRTEIYLALSIKKAGFVFAVEICDFSVFAYNFWVTPKRRPCRLQTADRADHADCADHAD